MEPVLAAQMPRIDLVPPQRLLVVDDDENLQYLYLEMFQQLGHSCVGAGTAEEAIKQMARRNFDIVLTDLNLPGKDGMELLAHTRECYPDVDVIVITGYGERYLYTEVIGAGACDFVTKPLRFEELEAKLNRVIRERSIIRELTRKNQRLEELERLVSRRLEEIQVTQGVTVTALAKIAEHRDPMISGHLDRMQNYVIVLANSLATQGYSPGSINNDFLSMIERGSILHDIGKMGIPEGILLKPGRLTQAEWQLMKMHTSIGDAILGDADAQLKELLGVPKTFLTMAKEIALNHHERWDGTGYPNGLAGEEIPSCARIVALADVYDAISSKRCYKDSMPHEECKKFLVQERGAMFDPEIVDCFLEEEDRFIEIHSVYT